MVEVLACVRQTLQNLRPQLGFFIVFTGAVIGFSASAALKDDFGIKAALFLALECITLIGLLQGVDKGRSTCIVGSYLRVFVEPYMHHMKWEIRLQEFRKENKLLGFFSYGGFTEYQILFYFALIVIDVVLCSVNVLQLVDSSTIPGTFYPWASVIVLWVATGTVLYKAWEHYEYVVLNQDNSITPIWEKIKRNEGGGQTGIGVEN
jgi:hypothetical protein